MSHSVTIVVVRGAQNAVEAESKLDDLLAPFDENMGLDPYPSWQDEEQVKSAFDFYFDNPQFCPGEHGNGPIKPFNEFVTEGDLDAFHEWTRQAVGAYGYGHRAKGIYDSENDRYGYYSTYNPDSKWDWWVVGGRWNGYFKVKQPEAVGAHRRDLPILDGVDNTLGLPVVREGQQAILGAGSFFGDGDRNFEGYADIARKGDIDFDGQRVLAAHQAEETFDLYERATEGLEPCATFEEMSKLAFDEEERPREWTDFLEQYEARHGDAEGAREEYERILDIARRRYNGHPWVEALRSNDLMGFMSNPHDDFFVGDPDARQKFIAEATDGVYVPFAVLLDGEWIERGHMGWWGIVSDEKERNSWVAQVRRIFDNLDDDVYLAAVDVHI